MNVAILNRKLAKQYENGTLDQTYGPVIAAAFNDLVLVLLAIVNESALYALKGTRPEKLKGRDPERSLRLNKQFRVIYRIDQVEVKEGKKTRLENRIAILDIEDYH